MESLDILGRRFGSDKFTRHDFGPIYEKIFSPLREQAKVVLEIGIGGEGYDVGGQSLLTWKEYFFSAKIVGIDIFDKSKIQDERIITEICDQNDYHALTRIAQTHGPFDVIIDDGTHKADDAARSLQTLFHHLRPGGIYVIEDIQTSYWSQYGGSSITPDWYLTNVKWLKEAIDIINSAEMTNQKLEGSSGPLELSELHVYHNLAAIVKSNGERHQSRVLTDEMRYNISTDDLFYNNGLRAVYDLYRFEPNQFRNFLAASIDVFNVLSQFGNAENIFNMKGKSFDDNLNKLLEQFRFSENQKVINCNLVANLSDTSDQYRTYIDKIEEARAQLALANERYRDYISILEEEKNQIIRSNADLSDACKQYQNYIAEIEETRDQLALANERYRKQIRLLEENRS